MRLPLDGRRPDLRESPHRHGRRHRVAVSHEDLPPRQPFYPLPGAADQGNGIAVSVRQEERESMLPHLVGEGGHPREGPFHPRRQT